MNKISRRGFFAIPATSATTAIAAASAAMAQPVVRTNSIRYTTCLTCKCGYVMVEVGPLGVPPEYRQFDVPPNCAYCCNSECDLFHVPFDIPKVQITEVRPVRYNR